MEGPLRLCRISVPPTVGHPFAITAVPYFLRASQARVFPDKERSRDPIPHLVATPMSSRSRGLVRFRPPPAQSPPPKVPTPLSGNLCLDEDTDATRSAASGAYSIRKHQAAGSRIMRRRTFSNSSTPQPSRRSHSSPHRTSTPSPTTSTWTMSSLSRYRCDSLHTRWLVFAHGQMLGVRQGSRLGRRGGWRMDTAEPSIEVFAFGPEGEGGECGS